MLLDVSDNFKLSDTLASPKRWSEDSDKIEAGTKNKNNVVRNTQI